MGFSTRRRGGYEPPFPCCWFVADTIQDYKALSQMQNLSPADKKLVQRQLALLPPRIKAAQEKEMGEMMGKLKQVSHSSPLSKQ